MEEWRDIQGYEGLYDISDSGRVRSLYRRVINSKSGATRLARGKIMTPWDNGNGYKVVCLQKEGKRKNHYVHRLVAEAFLKHSENETYINHKDYNTHNNCADNLEWCTQQNNIKHSLEHMRKPKTKCLASNTGEKYISRKVLKSGAVIYRVTIKGVEKRFKEFDDAIRYRNEVVERWQSQ